MSAVGSIGWGHQHTLGCAVALASGVTSRGESWEREACGRDRRVTRCRAAANENPGSVSAWQPQE